MTSLVYIANMRLPSERAHAGQIMRMCQAFAENGIETELIIPSRKTQINADPFEYYGTKPLFTITRLASIDIFPFRWIPKRVAYIIHTLSFSYSLLRHKSQLLGRLIFSRDPVSSFFLAWVGLCVTYEIHDTPRNSWFNKKLLNKVDAVVTTNSWKKQNLIKVFGVEEKKIAVAHHGVDIDMFDIDINPQQAKEILGMQNKTIALYTGHLFDWKGVYTLAQAAQYVGSAVMVLFVGGTDQDIKRMQRYCIQHNITNINCVGFKKHEEIPLYLAAADVLVIPTSARYTIGKLDSSPLKLFEYLATGKPIVASRVPAIEEVVSAQHVFFCEPDKPQQLAHVIQHARQHPTQKSDAQRARVHTQTWEARAQFILTHINSCKA